MTISQVEGKLNNVVMKIEEAEARLHLFRRLMKKNMCTKDVFQAAKSQLRSRRVLTKVDKGAIRRDMNLKARDAGLQYSDIISYIDKIEPEEPAPPMICSPEIILSENEISLLSKGPKFSVRSELESELFAVFSFLRLNWNQ